MNRAERRRHEAKQAKAGRAADSGVVQSRLDEGKAHLQTGRLREAEQAFRFALEASPRHPEALHLQGLTLYRLGRFDESIASLEAAIDEQRTNPIYWFNLGVVSQKASRHEDAIRAYRQAIKLNPRYLDAFVNLGNALKENGSASEARQVYEQALVLNPSHADTHNNLGTVLKDEGQRDRAIESYRKAIALKPTHLEAYNNLGLALMEQGSLDEAIQALKQALTIMPGYEKALYNLGIAWTWKREGEKAVSCFQQVANARHNHGGAVTESGVCRSRLKHDIEQVQYLLDHHQLGSEHRPYLNALEQLSDQLNRKSDGGNRAAIDPSALASIKPSFTRFLYRADCSSLSHPALNPSLDVEAVESRYLAKHPEVTFIDDLLGQEALESMRRFCWESTIWKKDYENGYIGAFLGDGFATPLLFQIADELRLKFPRIFKDHRLTQAWAFKHDSTRKGLNIHADAAAVNVNFWITPNEANLNLDTGGLVVYDKEAPREWNFRDYNSDRNKPKILEWLKQVGAQAVKIPYRANRAVVFNSDLFHETDEVSFKDDYLSRRINITLLYGYRLQA
jgi:tetratricopeptide (TPR) repeat protein